jgi:hypothetical protein
VGAIVFAIILIIIREVVFFLILDVIFVEEIVFFDVIFLCIFGVDGEKAGGFSAVPIGQEIIIVGSEEGSPDMFAHVQIAVEVRTAARKADLAAAEKL